MNNCYLEVEISPTPCKQVSVQPFSIEAVNHAYKHYLSGVDAVDHNRLSGLQGGESGNYYHVSQSTYNRIEGSSQFYTEVPSGVEGMSVLFDKTYTNIPIVVSNLLSPYNYTYLTSISEVSLTGFNILFSHQVNNTGFKLINLVYSI